MAVVRRMAAILFLLITLLDLTVGCDVDDVAVYKVSLQMLWSEERFPKDYPKNRPKAQWSQVFGGGSPIPLKKDDPFQQRIISLISTSAIGLFNPYDNDSSIPAMQDQGGVATKQDVDFPEAPQIEYIGQSHSTNYSLYHIGSVAKPSVRAFSQYGKIDDLVKQGDDEQQVYDQFSAPAIGAGTGDTENMVFVDGGHSLVSLMCRMIPSPDWFVGVDGVNLCVDSSWVDQITLDLEPLDGGAASGLTFTAPRWETTPPDPVMRHKPRLPDHPAAGFYYPQLRELPAIAKVEITKVKEYSTKELNDLARKELKSVLKAKNEHKGLPRKTIVNNHDYNDFNEEIQEHKVMTTRNYVDKLKDLEEEPVGTPRPNVPENYVVVVTKAPTTTTTEAEFEGELKNMDDVVLAVAHGRKLGLHKHLPRHFRSRLHHAVNKIQPNDCLVSEWSAWSPCSATCGFGDKLRYRSVVREKKDGGRDCPNLTDRKHCGNVNSCAHIDYFEW